MNIKDITKKLKHRKSEIFLVLILIFAAFLRLIFFVGPCCDDDVAYLNSAYNIVKLNFVELHNGYSFAYRTMMILPMALSFKIFGISEFTASLYILLTSLGSIIVAFFIGKFLFNARVGIFASLLLAFYPLEVIYSTHIVPDIPVAFFMGLSVLVFLYAEKNEKDKFYILSGVTAGLAYLVKITAILIVPFILFYAIFLLKRNKTKAILRFLLGFLLIFVIEMCYSYYFTSDPFTHYRSHVSAQKAWGHMRKKSMDEIKAQLLFYPNLMLGRGILALSQPDIMLSKGIIRDISPYCGYFFWLLVLSILFPWSYKKDGKRFLIVLFWFFSIFLFLQFGTMDIGRFVLIHRLTRFITILSIPMSLVIAHFLDVLIGKKPFVVMLVILGLFFLPLFLDSLARIDLVTSYENNQILGDTRELCSVLKTLPKKDIYFYQFTREFGLLKFYFNFDEDNQLKLLYDKPCDSIRNAYVVTDDNRWFFEGGPEYPECFKNPPENWKLIATIEKADEGIYRRFDPKIYYVP